MSEDLRIEPGQFGLIGGPCDRGLHEVAGDAEQSGANDMAYYLKLQQAMMKEQQAYTAVSTVGSGSRKRLTMNDRYRRGCEAVKV